MGADLYISSISEARREKYKPLFDAAVKARDACKHNTADEAAAQSAVDLAWDEMYGGGGYFRDSYNSSSVLWRMGLSWWQDVTPKVKNGKLSLTAIRWLLKEVTTRKLDLPTSPTWYKENGCTLDGRNTVEGWHKMWKESRAELIAFLKRALELKEPIEASL